MNGCPDCGKVTPDDTIHTCTPKLAADELRYYENRIESLEAKNKELREDLNEMKRRSWDIQDAKRVTDNLKSELLEAHRCAAVMEQRLVELQGIHRAAVIERDDALAKLARRDTQLEESNKKIRSMNGKLLAKDNANRKALQQLSDAVHERSLESRKMLNAHGERDAALSKLVLAQERAAHAERRANEVERKAGIYLRIRAKVLRVIGKGDRT